MSVRIDIDPEANVATVRFSEAHGGGLRTFPIEVHDEVVATVTFTPSGQLVDIELLDAIRQLPTDLLRQAHVLTERDVRSARLDRDGEHWPRESSR